MQDIYLNQNHLCMSYVLRFKNDSNLDEYFNVSLINKYGFTYKIHFHGNQLPRSLGYVEEVKCLMNLTKCKNMQSRAFQFKFTFQPRPYDTECLNYTSSKFKIKNVEQIDSKQACIQECIKQRFRSSLFLYTRKDRDRFELNQYGDLDQLDPEFIEQCQLNCPQQTCLIYYHNFFRVAYNEKSYLELHIKSTYNEVTFVSRYKNFEFFIQFFGFIGLTFGWNFLNFFYKIINRLKQRSVGLYVNQFKTIIDLVEKLMIICLYLTGLIISNQYLFEYMYHNKINTTVLASTINSNNLTLALCLTLNLTDYSNATELSLYDIELKSPNYSVLAKWPVVKLEDEEQSVISKCKEFYLNVIEGIYKCFAFDFYLNQLTYRDLLSRTYIVLDIKRFESIYVTQFGKHFLLSAAKFKINFKLKVRETKRLTYCRDYSMEEDNCDAQGHCIERCYTDNYLRLNGRLPPNHIVYSTYYNETDKKAIYFDLKSANKSEEIMSKCRSKYKLADCTSVAIDYNQIPFYENQQPIKSLNENSLNLYFDREINSLNPKLNELDVCLDLLTLASILIGINLPLLISYLIRKLSHHFTKIKIIENYLFIFYVLGFVVHFKSIIDDTFFSALPVDFVYKFNYLRSNEHIPNLIFCANFNFTHRKNERITGHLLDQRFSYINYSYVFEEIAYFDENLNEKFWRPGEERGDFGHSKQINNNIKITYFFLLRYKCFEISYKINFKNYKNTMLNTIMKIKLNDKHDKLIFNLKMNDTDDFNDYFDLYTRLSYRINFEYFYMSSFDLYQKVANPLLFFKKGMLID